jgi:NAD-dependent deacetylase
MADSPAQSIDLAARLIRGSRRLLVFTGAGISAESGVPTFRGQGGLWEKIDPGVLEITRFRRDPEACWKAIRELFYSASRPSPNAAHRILADWEGRGIVSFLVTQNIDGLHREAGSRRLAEFHGSIEQLACMRCGKKVEAGREALAAGLLDELPPRCSLCGGTMKPDFVFFGEAIPGEAYQAAFAAAELADLCLIVGSTGVVYPAAELPSIVKRRGGSVVEVDPGETEFSGTVTDVHIRLGAVEAMTGLDRALAP